MKHDFLLIASVIFAVIFWVKFFLNFIEYMSYNSPGNTTKRIDMVFHGRIKQFNIQGNLFIAILCTLYTYCNC